MGVYSHRLTQLASADHDFTHGRLPAVRFETRRSPLHQCDAAHNCRDSASDRVASDDGRVMAKRLRGGDFCDPPTPRRISRLDRRAQRCFKRRLFHAHDRRIRAVRASAHIPSLPHIVDLLCSRPHVQADAGHSSLCSPASRLLATAEISNRALNNFEITPRKNSSFDPGSSGCGSHCCYSASRDQFRRKPFSAMAHRQCVCELANLYPPNAMAVRSGGFLSALG